MDQQDVFSKMGNSGQVYGPSGATPELGTKVHVDHIREAWAWDVTSRAGTLPNAGGDSVPNKWFMKEAKGADVAVHECFFTPEQWVKIAGFPTNRLIG